MCSYDGQSRQFRACVGTGTGDDAILKPHFQQHVIECPVQGDNACCRRGKSQFRAAVILKNKWRTFRR